MEIAGVNSAQEEVEWMMTFVRAAEKCNLRRMKQCTLACPKILQHCNPDNPEVRSTEGFQTIKDLIIEDARRQLMEEMEETVKLEGIEEKRRKKESVIRKLKRLLPGSNTTIPAVRGEDGEVTADPQKMAEILATHWGRVFSDKPIDTEMLEAWLSSISGLQNGGGNRQPEAANEESNRQGQPRKRRRGNTGQPGAVDEEYTPKDQPLRRHRRGRIPLSQDSRQWSIGFKHTLRAIQHSNNSAPGPDGIPFGVWRALGQFGARVLADVAEVMEGGDAERQFVEAHFDEGDGLGHQFNLSTLVCLPKEQSGEDVELGAFYDAKATRPLNIGNTDNRLLASAWRARWEEQLSGYIEERQQGFLKGRSIIRNLLEVDTSMLLTALGGDKGAAIFLDFEAAFPSISHSFMERVLQWSGMPEVARNAFKFFYSQCHCNISMKGETFKGFDIMAGIRQGCPLSPIIYSLVAETLMDKLEEEVEGLFVRAYADDTVLVVKDLDGALRKLERIFGDYERCSGLRINAKRSVLVWLNGVSHGGKRAEIPQGGYRLEGYEG